MVKRLKTLKRNAVVGMTPDLWEMFRSGFSVPWSVGGCRPLTTEEAKAAWELYGDQIVQEYAAEKPGCRPHAWWAWSAPEEPRRLLGLSYVPATEIQKHPGCEWQKRETKLHPMEPYQGPCNRYFGNQKFKGELSEKAAPCTSVVAVYESEGEYLERHGLLFEQARAQSRTSPTFMNGSFLKRKGL